MMIPLTHRLLVRADKLEDVDKTYVKAKSLGIRIIVDIVPNHTSDQHAWFQAALAAGESSVERDYYHFKDGKGENGELPPNNWRKSIIKPQVITW